MDKLRSHLDEGQEIQRKYGGEWNERYLVFFGIALATFLITSNIMTLKFFEIGGMKFGAANLVFPFCLIAGDIITEVYGFKKTTQIIIAALCARMFFALSAAIVVALPPAAEWKLQPAFEAVFGQMPRNFVAGCFAYLAGELSNSYIMSRMKIWTNGKGFALRAMGSTVVGELANSAVFQLMAYTGVMPLLFLVKVIFNGTILKITIEALILPITAFICKKMKQLEGIDYFDRAPKQK